MTNHNECQACKAMIDFGFSEDEAKRQHEESQKRKQEQADKDNVQ